MKRHLWLFTVSGLLLAAQPAVAASWIFRPAAYTHDPVTCERVAQYLPERQPFYRGDDTYMESGYRHIRSALRGPDGSYDYQHVVQTWGLGESLRPYGEWEYPYRAGATPYGPWGNPSGPWTLPFDSWVNPYGLGRLPWGGWGGSSPWPSPNPWPHPGPHPGPGPGPGPHPNPPGPHPRPPAPEPGPGP